jgi:hypothetical protein
MSYVQVTSYLSESENLFVEDASIGSDGNSSCNVRVVSDSANAAFLLRSGEPPLLSDAHSFLNQALDCVCLTLEAIFSPACRSVGLSSSRA